MSTALATIDMNAAGVREYFRSGNVAQLTQEEKDFVLSKLCERYGLDPILRPFDLISFQGSAKFYMTASATNQLANLKGLTREIIDLSIDEAKLLAKCTVVVRDPQGRSETANAFIAVSKFLPPTKDNPQMRKVMLEGEDLANALMKLETKAKRKATLSFFGVMDAGADYEDRPTATQIQPDVSRPQVMADVAEAQKVVASPTAPATAPAPMPTAEEILSPATPEKKRGRPPKAQATPTQENNVIDVEASIPTVQTATPTAPVPVPVEIPIEIEPIIPAPVAAPKVAKVKYSRTQHATQLIGTATEIFGDAGWHSDPAKKEAVKAAIPELDGKVALFEEGSAVVLPEFKAALKAFLAKANVIKAG